MLREKNGKREGGREEERKEVRREERREEGQLSHSGEVVMKAF